MILTIDSPYKFETPWSAWEFSYHILHRQANLVILSMAWSTREEARSYSRAPKEPGKSSFLEEVSLFQLSEEFREDNFPCSAVREL